MIRQETFKSFADAPAVLTLEETAKLLRISYEGVKARANHGNLPGAFKSGKSWRVDKEVLIASFGTRPALRTEVNT